MGTVRGFRPLTAAGDLADVVGRAAAAAAHQVHEAAGREVVEVGRHPVRRLVEAPEGVGEPRVRVAAHGERRHRGQLLEERPHLLRPERAVDPHREERHVGDGVPEGLGGLAREVAAGAVGDGDAGHDGQPAPPLLEEALDGEERGLGVQGVEAGLDEQEVGAPVHEPTGLLVVGRLQLVERHRPRPGVVHVTGEGGRASHGTQGSPHPRVPLRVLGHEPVDRASGRLRPRQVQLVGQVLETVVLLRDAGGGEGVGLDDVGPRLQVEAVDLLHHVRAGDREQVGVALQVLRVAGEALAAVVGLAQALGLDHRAHGPVDDDDALGQERAQRFLSGRRDGRHPSSLAGPARVAPRRRSGRGLSRVPRP